MDHENNSISWRVPNKVFLWLSLAVIVLTWTMLIIAYPSLPSVIPSHFGPSGDVDATTVKTWWSVFMPAIIQAVIVILMWWLSYHPEYSNLPSGLTIRVLPEPIKTKVKKLLAHLLTMTGLLISLIMAYISMGIVRVSLGLDERLNGWAVFGLVGFLLLLVIVYSVRMWRITKNLVPKNITNK